MPEEAAQAEAVAPIVDDAAVAAHLAEALEVANKAVHDLELAEGSEAAFSLVFDAGAAYIPHPAKAYKGGEDAWFVADDGSALGVADGVSAWANVPGADAGLFARSIMEAAEEAANEAARTGAP